MFAAGFVDEVSGLAARGLRDAPTASRALGYAQVLDHLEGQSTLDDAIELTKRATRRFARRQESWFGRDSRIRWFDVSAESEERALADNVAEFVAPRLTDVASTRE
jgi:tRNA dimethylallyltransferase